MMDFLEPSVNFSVADYCEMASEIIRDIDSRGKIPVMVGGTGLYIDSCVSNTMFFGSEDFSRVRSELNAELENLK